MIIIIWFAPFHVHIIYVKYEIFEMTRGNMKGLILEKGQNVKIEEGNNKILKNWGKKRLSIKQILLHQWSETSNMNDIQKMEETLFMDELLLPNDKAHTNYLHNLKNFTSNLKIDTNF